MGECRLFKNKEGKVRSGWKVAGMIGAVFLASMLIGIVVSFISIIFYTVKMAVSGGITPDNLTRELESFSEGNSMLSILLMPLQELVIIILPVVTWKYLFKRPLSKMGLTKLKHNYKDFIAGLIVGIVAITLVFLLLTMSGSVAVTDWSFHFKIKQLAFIIVYISVGFAEEILARGYIMTTLWQTKNVYIAVFGSAIIFAFMHVLNNGVSLIAIINLTLVGVLLAYMYLKSGNLWMCIGFHITWNYFQGCVYGFEVSGLNSDGIITTQNIGTNIINGGAFGPEGGLITTVIILFSLLFIKQYYKNSKFDFLATE